MEENLLTIGMFITVEADVGGRPDRTAPELNVKGGQRYFRGCGQERQLPVGEGRGPRVGWERSDGNSCSGRRKCYSALGEALDRHKACPYRGRAVSLSSGAAMGLWLHKATSNPTTDWRRGVRGALRGESPRTREGRNGPTVQRLWSVGSCQWPGTARGAYGSVVARGTGICTPTLESSASSGGFWRFDECVAIDYDSGVAGCLPHRWARALCQKLSAIPGQNRKPTPKERKKDVTHTLAEDGV